MLLPLDQIAVILPLYFPSSTSFSWFSFNIFFLFFFLFVRFSSSILPSCVITGFTMGRRDQQQTGYQFHCLFGKLRVYSEMPSKVFKSCKCQQRTSKCVQRYQKCKLKSCLFHFSIVAMGMWIICRGVACIVEVNLY